MLRLNLSELGYSTLADIENTARSKIYRWQRKKVSLLIDPVFKEFHGIHEAAFSHRHDQVNRVEVFLAIKTSCQIGFMICGCMKAMTQRTSEPEHFLAVLYLKIQQINNNRIDGYLISEHSEKICSVMFCHCATFYGRENSAMVSFTKGSVIFFRLRAAALIRQAVATLLICRGTPPV